MNTERLEELSRGIASPEFLSFVAARTGLDEARVELLLPAYSAEAAVGARMLSGLDITGKRILEVGAGVTLLSLNLASRDLRITALEPGANGFDSSALFSNAVFGAAIRQWVDGEDLPLLDLEVERLDPEQHGRFDLIFSVNVLEHIPDLRRAIAAMERVLAPNGMMLHMCPNYAIPYEPHFGIPLVPLAPRLTALLAPRITGDPIWPSLNFVTHRQIRKLGRSCGLNATFRPAMLYEAFTRLDADEKFSSRHAGLVARLHRVLRQTGALQLLRYLPPAMATPMAFEYRRDPT